jgi:hypothetical protein
MIFLMVFVTHDVCVALKRLILLMAEQQQHQAVGVTLRLIKKMYDTPFLFLTCLMDGREKIFVVDTFIELMMNDNAIKQNGCCCCLYR